MKRLMVDVGSTTIKLRSTEHTHGPRVRIVSRDYNMLPGDQVRALAMTGHQAVQLRVCSSANGGVRVGVLGLSRRHSMAAAVRAAVSAGANVVYEHLLGHAPTSKRDEVDVLVMTGGVDGGNLAYLEATLRRTDLSFFPHGVAIWAGATTPASAELGVNYIAENVLDSQLLPASRGLRRLIESRSIADLIDRKGLSSLAGITDAAIWPTPAVLGLAAQRLARGHVGAISSPFIIFDVGGATTDVLYCAELRSGVLGRAVPPGESIIRHVFTDLGVVSSLPALQACMATESSLYEAATAIAPDRQRQLFHAISEANASIFAAPVGFLACLYQAVRRLTRLEGTILELDRALSIVITGGARSGASDSDIRRVICEAAGFHEARFDLVIDHDYELWALGLGDVPPAYPPNPAAGRRRQP